MPRRTPGHYINSAFGGCTCIGVIEGQHFNGDIEVYELSKLDRRAFVGAWYPDFALMIWPIGWYWSFEEKGVVGPPPTHPRTERFVLTGDNKWEPRRNPLHTRGLERKPLLVRHPLKRKGKTMLIRR